MISTLSKCLSLDFSRIQFTPDLMPADITGTEVIEENRSTGAREFKFLQGPLFRQRDPGGRNQPHAAQDAGRPTRSHAGTAGHCRPRASQALRSVFVAGHSEPIEQEGTYPLPEAQQDGSCQGVRQVPSFSEEFEIARRTTALALDEVRPVLSGDQILDLQLLVRKVPVTDHVIHTRSHWFGRRASAKWAPRSRGAIGCRGAPARGPCNTSSSAPKRGPCCMVGPTCNVRTSRPWPSRCSAIVLRLTSPRPAKHFDRRHYRPADPRDAKPRG